jgi:GT2 family glycosyltransferase
MNKKIGAVTVTFNSATVLDEFMESTLAQSHSNFVLYVIDNASNDGTLDVLAKYPDARVVLIANPDNRGVAEGNNQGIERALADGCDEVLLINNDTRFDAKLFDTMLAAAARLGADMLVPKMMYHDPENMIWCAGGKFDALRACKTVHFGDRETDRGQYDAASRISYAPTCCMLIKAEVFAKLGLMDKNYFVYYDDTDFCMRAKAQNISLWYDPEGVLYHKVSSLTGGETSDFAIRICTRNKVYFILKHYGRASALFWLIVYQLQFLGRLLAGRDRIATYKKKLRSFRLGLSMYSRVARGDEDPIPRLTSSNF